MSQRIGQGIGRKQMISQIGPFKESLIKMQHSKQWAGCRKTTKDSTETEASNSALLPYLSKGKSERIVGRVV